MTAFPPLSHLDHHSLTGHMIQHLLLMVVAAPLIILAIPSTVAIWRPSLPVNWLVGSLTVLLWHVPAIFELALQSRLCHEFERASFLIAGIVFWWPVIRPSPNSGWAVPIYLFLATLPCDALSAFLAFCGQVVYRPYMSGHTGTFGLSPIEDQALAGAVMWVTVTFVYLAPALSITARLLSAKRVDFAQASLS